MTKGIEQDRSPAATAERHPSEPSKFSRENLGADLGASLVVFLVALPLCVGVAVASGVPAELGIITGIVGGLVVGMLPGSTMQVSGPAAGLTVIVAEAVNTHGVASLGLIVLGAGLIQIILGLGKIGTWFRAISPAVVQGMLGGIGLVLILGQIYPLGGLEQPATTSEKFGGLSGLLGQISSSVGLSGLLIGALTVGILVAWPKMPAKVRLVPGPLVAVAVASAIAVLAGLPLKRIEVGSLLSSINAPQFASFGDTATLALLGSAVTFALVASAESLFSAAAVDRMHNGPSTKFNTELMAQGAGNTMCGLLGALPMTAVIIRSSANVSAGARTKVSRILHGVWLVLFVMVVPGVLNFIPTAVLAALLIHSGYKLIEVKKLGELARTNRPEAGIVALTMGMIVGTDLLVGTLVGLGASIIKTAWDVSHLHIKQEHADDEHVQVRLSGTATFLRLPRLLDALERLPVVNRVHLDLTPVRHLDRACHQAVESWAERRRRSNCHVEVALPGQAS